MSRTEKLIKNAFFGIVGKAVTLLLSFVSRTVFIMYLGETYLGINGLYSEILSALSFAELGLGTALVYAMYGPVAREEREKTLQLLDFYRKAYRIIAGTVVLAGLCILPFLQHIVRGADAVTLFELRLYYIIFLSNTTVSYFATYKYSYVNALQKNYITASFDAIVNVVIVVVQIAVIIGSQNFLVYLLTHTGLLILSRGAAAIYLDRRFPILKEKSKDTLEKEERHKIYGELKSLSVKRFAAVAIHSTDNIIISSLSGLGVLGVALVSNYTLLINNVINFVNIPFSNVMAGFGNLAATESQEAYKKAFLEMNFLNFWVYAFCSTAFFVLIPPFITLWLGSSYLIDPLSFSLIIANCYLQGQCGIYEYIRVAKGNFALDLFPSVAQAVVNLVVSVIGAVTLGLVGVYIGTVVSRLVYSLRPLFSYRFLFGCSAKEYYKKFFQYLSLAILAAGLTYFATRGVLQDVTVRSFVLAMLIVIVIPNGLFFILYSRSREFRSIINRAKEIFMRR